MVFGRLVKSVTTETMLLGSKQSSQVKLPQSSYPTSEYANDSRKRRTVVHNTAAVKQQIVALLVTSEVPTTTKVLAPGSQTTSFFLLPPVFICLANEFYFLCGFTDDRVLCACQHSMLVTHHPAKLTARIAVPVGCVSLKSSTPEAATCCLPFSYGRFCLLGSQKMNQDKRRRIVNAKTMPMTAQAAVVDYPSPMLPDTVAGQAQHEVGASFAVPGLVLTEHRFQVPLDHTGRTPGNIQVFAREAVSPSKKNQQLPYLCYLQGGPGYEAPRPTEASAWIKAAVANFRVILLDQRGTGASTPVSAASLHHIGTPQQQAEYLSFFRADSIVRDAELVRQALVPPDLYGGRWTILGQSFGGFCAVTYLSFAPQGLVEVLLTGGLPGGISLACSADTVYRACFRRVVEQNARYYKRFPGDVAQVHRIVRYLTSQPGGSVTLPSGSRLTPRSLQLLGLTGLGMSGGFERLHFLLESAFDANEELSAAFIKGFEMSFNWDSNPLYAVLHESIYCQGEASRWSAQRVRDREHGDAFNAVKATGAGLPVMFTGEMIFPFMFNDFACLRPMKEAAEILAARTDWPALYDAEALKQCVVPVASATYFEDMYVDFNLAQETAAQIRGIQQWITNEFMHSGVRDNGGRIFDHLLGMVRGSILTHISSI